MWAASGPAEFIDSAAKPPAVTGELADGQCIYTVGKTFMREVPYDWQVRGRALCFRVLQTLPDNFCDDTMSGQTVHP